MRKISVIVPVYKVEKYLDRCVESIVEQTFTDFELILVDDGSPDNCPAMCDEWAKKDSRIRVIHQQNGGLSAARNAGIDWAFANSDSEWLTFIDSDDWVHEKYLECLYSAVKEHGVLVGICGYERTSGELPAVQLDQFVPILWNVEEFYITYNVNANIACAKLYKKECFEFIRFPVGKIHEDEFTTYKTLFLNNEVVFVPAALYTYYENPESITRVLWSPKRLVALDAHKERVDYFAANGKDRLYKWNLNIYIWYIIAMIETVAELDDAELSGRCSELLMKRLRKELLVYHKDLPFSQFVGAYEIAFPKIVRLYYIALSIKNRFKK